jgi:hypothetical protein
VQGCSGGSLLCDRCDGVARAGWAQVVRERKRAEREKESKEQAGVLGVAGVAWDSEKESRDSEESIEQRLKSEE